MMTKTGLIILDGWGYREETEGNAIALAQTPHFDTLFNQCPHTLLDASGCAVGLPDGQMGNSEVGHLHIGTGRVIEQSLSLINRSAEQNFTDRTVLLNKLHDCKERNVALHVIGLLSSGGVHSHENHIFSLLQLCKKIELKEVYLHLFTDGRDVPPKSSQHNIIKLNQKLTDLNIGEIASLCGRFYAMDRDQRWQRTQSAYDLIVHQKAQHNVENALYAIQMAYKKGQSDEFIEPTLIGKSPAPNNDDVIILMNFRIDRMRQLTEPLVNQSFAHFPIKRTFQHVLTLTQYHPDYHAGVIFPPYYPQQCLGEHLADLSFRQLRIAETEKYPHVTFFFNGGRDIQYHQEQRYLIPSPKVATYDLQPEMSAKMIKNRLIHAIECDEMDMFMCNFANPDMVGHSGNLSATIIAVQTVDSMLGEVCATAKKYHWQLIITADHGNSEIMQDSITGEPHTAHTLSPVPFIIYNSPMTNIHLKQEGGLIDIAPTMLRLMSQEIPQEMTGTPLFH